MVRPSAVSLPTWGSYATWHCWHMPPGMPTLCCGIKVGRLTPCISKALLSAKKPRNGHRMSAQMTSLCPGLCPLGDQDEATHRTRPRIVRVHVSATISGSPWSCCVPEQSTAMQRPRSDFVHEQSVAMDADSSCIVRSYGLSVPAFCPINGAIVHCGVPRISNGWINQFPMSFRAGLGGRLTSLISLRSIHRSRRDGLDSLAVRAAFRHCRRSDYAFVPPAAPSSRTDRFQSNLAETARLSIVLPTTRARVLFALAEPERASRPIIWLARAVNVVRPAVPRLHIDRACFAKRRR